MSSKKLARAAAAKVSDNEARAIADMMFALLTELAKGHRQYVRPPVTRPESTGTGHLPPEVKQYVYKASAA